MDQYPMITQQFYGFGLCCLNSTRVSAFSPYISQKNNAPSNAYGRSSQGCKETKVKVVSSYSSVTKKFSWKIDEFSKLNAQDGTYSDVFSVGDYKWKVRIHPKGEGKVYDHLSVFLKPVELTKSVETEFSIEVTCQTDPNNSVRHGTKRKFLERRGNKSYGWPRFMPLNEIYDPDKGYIVNDTCVVTIEITCKIKGEELEFNADGGTSNGESNPDKVPVFKRRRINDERQ